MANHGMVSINMDKFVETVMLGMAMASLWFWVFCIYNKVCDMRLIRIWFRVIVPQAIIIAFVLKSQGWV